MSTGRDILTKLNEPFPTLLFSGAFYPSALKLNTGIDVEGALQLQSHSDQRSKIYSKVGKLWFQCTAEQ